MKEVATAEFSGLPDDFFRFFEELAENNSQAWHKANAARRRASVEGPLRGFASALAPRLRAISPHLAAEAPADAVAPARRSANGASIDKPYKEHGGVLFCHATWNHARGPCCYVHIAPEEIYFGGGVWSPDADGLLKIREAIRDHGEAWLQAKTGVAFDEAFTPDTGESLTEPPEGFAADHPHIEDIKRKSFFAIKPGSRDSALSARILDDADQAFREMKDFLKFLCDALRAPF